MLTDKLNFVITNFLSIVNSIDIIKEISKRKKEVNFLTTLILIVSFIFCYFILLSEYTKINNVILIFITTIVSSTIIIYITNRNKYNRLIEKYNNVLEYVSGYEEELEKDMLMRHEHKNQLAVIKGISKNKKVISYIDEILKNIKKDSNLNITNINKLPKGGIKGLIYYKICCIKKKNIKYSLEISRNIRENFEYVSEQNKKVLSYILGVFLDNAIEECNDQEIGNICIEMYTLKDKINIVVSNTISDKIDIKKIGKKGYSTKGKNRGNGIFLVEKLIKKNKNIETTNKIINNYFIQEITIKI